MRPDILNPLFTDITALNGVGPRIALLIQKVAGPLIVDLAMTLPVGIIDRTYQPGTAAAPDGIRATFQVRVESHHPPPKLKTRQPYKVICSDDSGFIVLIFFHAKPDWIEKSYPLGSHRIISGKVERYGGELQMAHPEINLPANEAATMPLIEPVYPLTAGLSGKIMTKAVAQALARLPDLPEWHRTDIIAKHQWPGWKEALLQAHRPTDKMGLNPQARDRQRLAYDELLANQIALRLVRQANRKLPGRVLPPTHILREKILGALPFQLTQAQQQALSEIDADMGSENRMIRLLQGDVGSGKTIVALLAMVNAVENGAQAALIAPTEILALQHFDTLKKLTQGIDIQITLLTGSHKGQERQAILRGLEAGYVDILIGTHALFSEDVHYQDLAMIVVDEQHRFGVHQRLALQEKGRRADVLVTTATPIPRTLALTTYGDMDQSRLQEKPPGRLPVDTRALPMQRLNHVIEAIGRAIDRGEQVYWVCPLVEQSDRLSLTAAQERYDMLRRYFADKVGLVHGKMKSIEKDQAVEGFYRGEIRILVATTVIEVGVDAPNATIMVIEHAERFGLAQLHQLRGRVGRGDKKSTCLMLYQADEQGQLGETAKARLQIMRQSEDGFLIAEEDLRLRGAGNALGTEQSGFPHYRLADLAEHKSLLEMAHDDARLIVQDNPKLEGPRGDALRILLYLFGRDEAIKRLRSG